MKLRIWHLVTVAALSFLLSDKVAAQNPVRFNWTAVTGAQSGLFMAQQENLFKKNGLEVELLHIPSSSRGIQAILAGEIAFSFMDGVNAAQANLKGANLALVAGATNRQVFSLMAKPEIKRIADLKGKKIGITRVGSSTHTSALYALGSGGLKPSDYQILPLMEVPNIFTALTAGQIDAGLPAIEVFHPDHDDDDVARYRAIARERQLIVTGGSDYHGPGSGRTSGLGRVGLPADEFARLEQAAGARLRRTPS